MKFKNLIFVYLSILTKFQNIFQINFLSIYFDKSTFGYIAHYIMLHLFLRLKSDNYKCSCYKVLTIPVYNETFSKNR